jgi:SAM-dependent methyltransferase
MSNSNWFVDWFNTKYYHILYKNRDEQEAKDFIQKLVEFLAIKPNTKVLDLACGRGRHAVTLNELGMDVVGLDLSNESIAYAQQFSNDTLHFDVHDMRLPLKSKFQYVFNLFTSFGYFDEASENEKVLQSVNEALPSEGILVIDFMNAYKVIKNMVKEETKQIDALSFQIHRSYDGNHIYKDISFVDGGQNYHFTERVQALQLEDFELLLTKTGFKVNHLFGNFKLEHFEKESADRLIIIAEKI